MNALEAGLAKLVGGVTASAVDTATAKANDTAAQIWEQLKPWVYLIGFCAGTAWLLYFLPRFRLPWQKA